MSINYDSLFGDQMPWFMFQTTWTKAETEERSRQKDPNQRNQMEISWNVGTPVAGGFAMENRIKKDDLGVPLLGNKLPNQYIFNYRSVSNLFFSLVCCCLRHETLGQRLDNATTLQLLCSHSSCNTLGFIVVSKVGRKLTIYQCPWAYTACLICFRNQSLPENSALFMPWHPWTPRSCVASSQHHVQSQLPSRNAHALSLSLA